MNQLKHTSLLYDKIAQLYAKEFLNPSEHIHEFIELLSENAQILDVGCGVGVDSNFVKLHGHEVIGLDLSAEMLKLARQSFPEIDFRQQDIREIDFPEGSFDGIIASYSLIHIPKRDIPFLLGKFYQILKDGGVIYFSLQGGESQELLVDEPFKPDEKIFLNIHSIDEINNLLTLNNFSILKKYERKPQSEKELNFTKLYLITKKYK